MDTQKIDAGFEKVWKMFQETDKKHEQLSSDFREIKEMFKEIGRKFEETDRQFKETDRQFKETDKKFQETDRRFKETDRRFQETDRQFKETDKKFQETNKRYGNLSDKWSRFVEGMIVPGVERLFKERHIDVNTVYQQVRRRRGGEEMEVDILALDGEYAVLIEAKSTLNVDDIDEHVNRLSKFKRLFPEYADRKAVGAVGGVTIHAGVDKYAYRKGFFVITQHGENVKILNDPQFKPKEW